MDKPNYYLKIGPYIKKLREKNNMTRSQLAEGICSVSYITRIEKGDRCPTSVILRQLATKLGISNEYLFRAIESPSSMHVQQLSKELSLFIERNDFKNIYKLINKEEKEIQVQSVHDKQLIDLLKCISKTLLTEDYSTVLSELETILNLTYFEGNNPTSIEFATMFMYGYFLLLRNEKQKSYTYLKNIRKYLYTIDFFMTEEIVPKYYVYLISACIDTENFNECFEYLNFSIDYCKKYNKHTVLRELYFLKGELYYHLNNKEKFKLWYDKALMTHELTKYSDSEYFESFIKNRLNSLKN